MSAISILRTIWSFILGSLRMILFFGCFIFVIVQLVSIAIILYADHALQNLLPFADSSSMLPELIKATFFLCVGLLGCYGSFYKHHPSLRFFAFSTAISSAVIIVLVLYCMSPEQLTKMNDNFGDQMDKLAPKYDWESKSGKLSFFLSSSGADSKSKEATRSWDTLQELHCCGWKGPSDWNKTRPDKFADMYPSSCCPVGLIQNRLCEKTDKDLFTTGCLERIQLIEGLALISYCVLIAYLLTLCLMSCIIGHLNVERCCGSLGRDHSTSNSNVPGNTSHEYTRFESSPNYTRQPPINVAHDEEIISTSQKIKPPPVYPNAYDVEGNPIYSSPPPSYGR